MKKFIFLLFFGMLSAGLFAQWEKISSYPEYCSARTIVMINDTLVAPHNGNAYDPFPGIYISTDHGNSWSEKITSLGISANPLIVFDGKLYAGTWGYGVFYSNDGGLNWDSAGNGLRPSYAVTDLVSYGNDLYVTGTKAMYHSENGGESWTDITYPGTKQVNSVMASGDTVFAVNILPSERALFRTVNGGGEWEKIDSSSGLTADNVHDIKNVNNILFAPAGLPGGLLYLSYDSGISWVAAEGLDDLGNNYVNNFISYNNLIFAATINGVYMSANRGLNWKYVGIEDVFSLLVINDTLFASAMMGGLWKRSISEMSDINEFYSDETVKVYPNPSRGLINVEIDFISEQVKYHLSLHDSKGRLVLQKKNCFNNMNHLNVNYLGNGIYYLKISSDKLHGVKSTKVIISK